MKDLKKYIKKRIHECLEESIKGYHGSQHKFDSFLTQNIGTGIGTQGFGWGLYFADIRGRAKSYAENLEGEANVMIDNMQVSPFIRKYVSTIVKQHGNNKELVLHILKANLDKPLDSKKITRDEYDFIMGAKQINVKRSRYIYQIELHKNKNPNEYDFLNWNTHITDEQLLKIKNQMDKENYSGRVSIENGRIYKTIGDKSEIKNGSDIYRAFAGDKNFNEKEASLFLLRSGIDGIKYQSDNGWDYVVFDPNSITINKVNSF